MFPISTLCMLLLSAARPRTVGVSLLLYSTKFLRAVNFVVFPAHMCSVHAGSTADFTGCHYSPRQDESSVDYSILRDSGRRLFV